MGGHQGERYFYTQDGVEREYFSRDEWRKKKANPVEWGPCRSVKPYRPPVRHNTQESPRQPRERSLSPHRVAREEHSIRDNTRELPRQSRERSPSPRRFAREEHPIRDNTRELPRQSRERSPSPHRVTRETYPLRRNTQEPPHQSRERSLSPRRVTREEYPSRHDSHRQLSSSRQYSQGRSPSLHRFIREDYSPGHDSYTQISSRRRYSPKRPLSPRRSAPEEYPPRHGSHVQLSPRRRYSPERPLSPRRLAREEYHLERDSHRQPSSGRRYSPKRLHPQVAYRTRSPSPNYQSRGRQVDRHSQPFSSSHERQHDIEPRSSYYSAHDHSRDIGHRQDRPGRSRSPHRSSAQSGKRVASPAQLPDEKKFKGDFTPIKHPAVISSNANVVGPPPALQAHLEMTKSAYQHALLEMARYHVGLAETLTACSREVVTYSAADSSILSQPERSASIPSPNPEPVPMSESRPDSMPGQVITPLVAKETTMPSSSVNSVAAPTGIDAPTESNSTQETTIDAFDHNQSSIALEALDSTGDTSIEQAAVFQNTLYQLSDAELSGYDADAEFKALCAEFLDI